MNANKAIELGFADDVLKDTKAEVDVPAYAFSGKEVANRLYNKIAAKSKPTPKAEPTPAEEPEATHGRSYDELMARLNLMKY